MTITGRQIRGARGLLGWSMGDLARRTELTMVTIRHIESELVQPQEKTIAKIMSVFDRHGIEFQENEGIRIRKQEVRIFTGKTGYRQLLDHVYLTLEGGGRIRQFNFGDMRYLPYADEFVGEHLKRMTKIKNLDACVLEGKGETEIPVSYCRYRTLDKAFKDMAPWYLYGDFLIMPLFETGAKKEFITLHSKLMAERYVREFEIFWTMAGPSGKQKTHERAK